MANEVFISHPSSRDTPVAGRDEKRDNFPPCLAAPFDFSAFLRVKREGFTGRHGLFEAIDLWAQSPGPERVLLIKGEPGIGKSALAAELLHRNPGGRILAYHICRWNYASTLEPWRFVPSIAAMIAGKRRDYAALLAEPGLREVFAETSCCSDPAGAFERGVLAPLQKLGQPAGGPRYLLVDALDEAAPAGSGRPDLVSMLASRLDRFPPWLRLIATATGIPAALDLPDGLRVEEIKATSAGNLADLETYIRAKLEGGAALDSVPQPQPSTADLARRLVQKSGGNFLHAGIALEDIAVDPSSPAARAALPSDLRGLFANRFARLFPDEAAFAGARAVLAVICAAREPVGRDLLAEASGWGEDLSRVLARLAVDVPGRPETEGQPVYAPLHQSLAHWLTDPAREGELHHIAAGEGNRGLAEACWKHYRLGVEKMPPYALAHLLPHLIGSARWPEAETALLHLPYLEARIRAGQVFPLAEDFTAMVEAMPVERPEWERLRLLDEALRRDLHFIARHARDYPQAFFQCLWNSAWWHDCPEAAFHYKPPMGGWKQPPPWESREEGLKLSTLLQRWRTEREAGQPGFFWLSSTSPPAMRLGTGAPAILQGHKDVITCAAFSSDGRRALSGSDDCTVRLWDAANGRELVVLRGHEDRVYSVAFSPDGGRALSGSSDKTARIWDTESGHERTVLRGHEKAVSCVLFSPDGRRVLTGSLDRTLRLWDAESGHDLAVLRGHEYTVLCAAFSPDGRRVLSGSGDMSVRLWDAEDGNERAVLRGHEGAVTSAAFSPDGRRLLTGSGSASFRRDVTVRLWDAEDGNERAVLRGHVCEVTAAAFSSDGRRIISRDFTGKTLVWDAETGRCLSAAPGDGEAADGAAFDSPLWHASVEDGETRVRSRPGAVPEARFPEVLRNIQSSGRIWAGGLNHQLVFLRLESGNGKTDPAKSENH